MKRLDHHSQGLSLFSGLESKWDSSFLLWSTLTSGCVIHSAPDPWVLDAVVCVVCLVPPVFAGIPATPEVLYLFSEQTQKVPERFCRYLTVVFCCSRRRGWALE